MRRISITLLVVVTLIGASEAQTKKKKKQSANPSQTQSTTTAAGAPAAVANPNASLETVLTQLDRSAANFRSAQADFVWDQFQAIVQEHDLQKGKVYFVRHEKDTHMAANITEPNTKKVVFTEGKVRLYQPKIDQVTEYEAGKNREEVESFMVLGFGGRGHDLLKSFEVKYLGDEVISNVKVDEVISNVKTYKLELTPRAERIRNMFSKFVLWVDPQRDVSLKQQAFEPSGDYRTATYSNIKLNEKIPDDIFKLHTTNKTKVVKP
jgi:outer membrane lipoprotein-sorting protein